MICDAHVHFIPEELSLHTSFYKGVWTDKGKLYDFLNRYGIEKALLTYPSTDAHLKLGGYGRACELYNRALEQILKENPKLIACAVVNVADIDTIPSQVKRFDDAGFKGISIASSYDGRFPGEDFYGLFEAAEKYNMIVFVHPQTINPIGFERVKDPLLMPVLEYSFDVSMFMGLLMMNGVFQKFKVNFVFSSLGGVVPFLKERLDRVYAMLRKRDMVKDLGKLPSQILNNVFVDTSGASAKNIQLSLDLFGEDKILWGSDYPVNADVEENLSMLDGLGRETKEKIVYKNFLELFPGN